MADDTKKKAPEPKVRKFKVVRADPNGLIFKGMQLKVGDVITGEDVPRCGKGTDLASGKKKVFEEFE